MLNMIFHLLERKNKSRHNACWKFIVRSFWWVADINEYKNNYSKKSGNFWSDRNYGDFTSYKFISTKNPFCISYCPYFTRLFECEFIECGQEDLSVDMTFE